MTDTPPPQLADHPVLVTGARGFIGAHLCRRLAELGAQVHGVSRREHDDETARWHQLDLADAKAVEKLIDEVQPGVIFHLASHVYGGRDLALVRPTFDSNLVSTVNLLEAIERVGCCRRFLLTGSLEEPGDDEPLAPPASPYAAAKAAASAYAKMFHALYGTPVVRARLFMVYGPAQKDLKKLIPYVSLSLASGREIKLSSGLRPVDWVYVDDVAEGLVRAAEAPGLEGRRIDLGTGKLVTIRGVVETLFRLAGAEGEPPFGTLPDRPFEQVRSAEAEATHELLGWHPSTPVEEGLRKTFEWYRGELDAGRISADDF